MVMTPVSDDYREHCEMEQDLVAIFGGSQQVILNSKVSSHHGWQHAHLVRHISGCQSWTLWAGLQLQFSFCNSGAFLTLKITSGLPLNSTWPTNQHGVERCMQ
jgi:hypothetical protein